ncbi:MAG TPA: beta-phosphoglucomutase family hydrolase [Bacteroidales bacterium]|nr:beta-phosphoglucomutase family hydrolase [Bacteroidales bacterium]
MPDFKAVIFDLDGVITKTALVHGSAWKKMFDAYLKSREERFNEPFKEFTHADDYLPYVDGKPRYKGVDSFLKSRGIDIPFGDPSDDPEEETVCALGNRKNLLFNKVLDEEGVQVYDSTVALIKQLKELDVRIGVASSSKNCKPVLETADLLKYVETRIDGVVSAEIGLQGKPEPDIFTTACDRLGVSYHKAIVVEDAVSGVQAGKKGNFGLTIGVAREENVRELRINGGDIVVEDLGELTIDDLNNWFKYGIEDDSWKLNYYDYDHDKERSREALLAVGNGYFGTRGALEESTANKVNYPGTYVSGLFNRRTSKVGDRDIENEDFVNITNWLPVTFRIDDGEWFEFKPDANFKIEKIHRQLNMRNGTLLKYMVVVDNEGRRTRVKSLRFAGMHDPHRAAMNYSIQPLNYSGHIEIQSLLSADHINAGVERYSDLDQQHLEPVSENSKDNILQLLVKTNQSDIKIGAAARHRINRIHINSEIKTGKAKISELFKVEARINEEISLEKMVSLYTTIKNDSEDPIKDAVTAINDMEGFYDELKKSEQGWDTIWGRMNVKVIGDRNVQRLLHLHQYHMMVTASPYHAGLDAGIPPRGLHGEAYRGHIFWDELYMLPFYNLYFPAVAKSTLVYRYQRLDEARKYAKEYGFEGAMFPWQSGSDGREETQVVHLNPLSGEWGDDYSSLQRHISLAIANNIWNYYFHNTDRDFMEVYGNEMFFDICKFWISKTSKGDDGKYHIDKVMGPDEFHEKLPGAQEGGLTDNAYTNIMVSWMLDKAEFLKEDFKDDGISDVLEKLEITEEVFDYWKDVEHNLALNINEDGIIEHFKGYFDLEELDWDAYREKYDDIHRLDRILKAEDKSPDAYKLSKQADLLMTFYNLGEEETTKIIEGMGYELPEDYFRKNFDYYIKRTSHGSTLSRLVHARLAFKLGLNEEAMTLYTESLESDLNDIQGGTTGEGIHCGVMAGTIYDTLVAFAGLDLSHAEPVIKSNLPSHWVALEFKFGFRGDQYHFIIAQEEVIINISDSEKNKIKLHICDNEVELETGKVFKVICKN